MNIKKDMGWGKKGRLISSTKSGKYYKKTNIVAGLNGSKPIAPMTFNGTCDKALFEAWVEHFLIKELKPGQVVIMDNASFHKSEKTQKLIQSVDCKVIFLPPYSPDLNPIEKFWANMKRWVKSNIAAFNNLYDAIVTFFQIPCST